MADRFVREGIPAMKDLNLNISPARFTVQFMGFPVQFVAVRSLSIPVFPTKNPTAFESGHAAEMAARDHGLKMEYVAVKPA